MGILSWLAGCGDSLPPEDPVRLPPGLVEGATDPLRWALAQVESQLVDRPGTLAGRPAEAARAVLLVEFLSTALMGSGLTDVWHLTRRWREGRAALRASLGLATEPPPVAMAEALVAAEAALARGDGAAVLAALAPVAPKPETVLDALGRISAPGPLRRAVRETQDTLRQGQTR